MENKTPLYGIISYSGGQYTVIFEKTTDSDGTTTTSSLNGYGGFPFSDYPNIPVIDYTSNDSVFTVLSWNKIITESDSITAYDSEFNKSRIMTLQQFLNRVESLGIKIHNYKNEVTK